MKDPAYADGRYDLRPIVGIEQPTAQSALARRRPRQAPAAGSRQGRPGGRRHRAASVGDAERVRRGSQNAIYAAERHASLQNDDDVLFQLNGILTAAVVQPGRLPGRVAKIGLSLDVEDWLAPTEPLEVRARPHGDPGGAARRGRRGCRDGRGDARASSSAPPTTAGTRPSSARSRRASTGSPRSERSVEPVTDLVTVVGE